MNCTSRLKHEDGFGWPGIARRQAQPRDCSDNKKPRHGQKRLQDKATGKPLQGHGFLQRGHRCKRTSVKRENRPDRQAVPVAKKPQIERRQPDDHDEYCRTDQHRISLANCQCTNRSSNQHNTPKELLRLARVDGEQLHWTAILGTKQALYARIDSSANSIPAMTSEDLAAIEPPLFILCQLTVLQFVSALRPPCRLPPTVCRMPLSNASTPLAVSNSHAVARITSRLLRQSISVICFIARRQSSQSSVRKIIPLSRSRMISRAQPTQSLTSEGRPHACASFTAKPHVSQKPEGSTNASPSR